MRDIDLIVIHAAATPPDMDIGADEIRRWHVDERGWSDIGYHYVIRRNGEAEGGRPVERQGAHVRGHNASSIGICMVGGINGAGDPDCNYTASQWERLAVLVEGLAAAYPNARICGHRDLDPHKACPVFDAAAWAADGIAA